MKYVNMVGEHLRISYENVDLYLGPSYPWGLGGYERCFIYKKKSCSDIKKAYLWPDGSWKKEMYRDFTTSELLALVVDFIPKKVYIEVLKQIVLKELIKS